MSVCVCLVSAHAYADEPLAFKEPLDARVRASQFTIYARIHPGFGIQFRKKQTLKSGVAGTVGFVLMGFPGIAAGPLAKRSKYTPTFLSVESAERLAPFFDAAVAQSTLEQALTQSVGALPLVATPPLIKPLEPDVEVRTADLTEDPVLVVDVYTTLTTSYRALQVTAIVYGLSPAKLATDPLSNKTGRVYLNRFDYVSDPLPVPPVLTAEERKEKREDIRARYAGELTEQQSDKRKEELERVDGTVNPFDESAATLMDVWLAQDGAKLHEEFQRGIWTVTTLLKADLTDLSAVVPAAADVSEPIEVMQDDGPRRTVRYLAEPFAGAVMSVPVNLNEVSCQGIAFKEELPDGGATVCGEAVQNFGAVCPSGRVYAAGHCREVMKKTRS